MVVGADSQLGSNAVWGDDGGRHVIGIPFYCDLLIELIADGKQVVVFVITEFKQHNAGIQIDGLFMTARFVHDMTYAGFFWKTQFVINHIWHR